MILLPVASLETVAFPTLVGFEIYRLTLYIGVSVSVTFKTCVNTVKQNEPWHSVTFLKIRDCFLHGAVPCLCDAKPLLNPT
jgi:hypothetical protein